MKDVILAMGMASGLMVFMFAVPYLIMDMYPRHRWFRQYPAFLARRQAAWRFEKYGHVLGNFDATIKVEMDPWDHPESYDLVVRKTDLGFREDRIALARLAGIPDNWVTDNVVSWYENVHVHLDPFILPYIQTYVKLKS
jgi:hypothetical protein